MADQQATTKELKTILVTGDLAIDWYNFISDPKEKDENWKQFSSRNTATILGGAFQLTTFIAKLIDKKQWKVVGPQCEQEPFLASENILRSNCLLEEYPHKDKTKKEKFWRVSKYEGYSKNIPDKVSEVYPEVQKSEIVVIDDANNGIRNDAKQLNQINNCLTSETTIIYKYGSPIKCHGKNNPLWDVISKQDEKEGEDAEKKLVVIINADDLRRTECVRITKSLSWERTAVETVFAFCRQDSLKQFENTPYIIILFGMEGAILLENKNQMKKATLLFDNNNLEEQFINLFSGHVSSKSSLFTASIVDNISKNGFSNLKEAIIQGLLRVRALQEVGYKMDTKKCQISFPDLIYTNFETESIHSADIPIPSDLDNADASYWQILESKKPNSYLKVARDIFKVGVENAMKDVPLIKFGALVASDRREIEQLSAIRELISEYLANPKPERPLSFAVFGAPGAGKSFSVKQIVKSIGNDSLDPIIFNISQFTDYNDLVKALHRVRNITLKGKIPFVFFDEFDCDNLKWLKHFLAPMQDAEFKEGETVHPLGNRIIFIFAGGTNTSFIQFSQLQNEKFGESSFKDLKGPDFISRLRGFIDIMGVDRVPQNGNDDTLFILRRAKLLNIMLINEPTAKDLISNKEINIDDGVMRALLHINEFKHGVRSIAAIYDMSRLSGKKIFSRDCLPSREQLNMHVDADEFMFLVERERYASIMPEVKFKMGIDSAIAFDGLVTDKIFSFIADEYDRNRELKNKLYPGKSQNSSNGEKIKKAEDYAKSITKEELKEHFKISNKDVAADIPRKLLSINISLRPQSQLSPWVWYTTGEANILAEMEHERWMNERKNKGWYFSKKTNRIFTAHEDMQPFNNLSNEEKEKDYEQVYAYLQLPNIINKIVEENLKEKSKTFLSELYRTEDVEIGSTELNDLSMNIFDTLQSSPYVNSFISSNLNNSDEDANNKKKYIDIQKLALTILSSKATNFREELAEQSLYNIWLCNQLRNKKLFILAENANKYMDRISEEFVIEYKIDKEYTSIVKELSKLITK